MDFNEHTDTNGQRSINKHKEEYPGRIKADDSDRNNIQLQLGTCINPLLPETHSTEAVANISTGQLFPILNNNVWDAVEIDRKQVEEFSTENNATFLKPNFKKSLHIICCLLEIPFH